MIAHIHQFYPRIKALSAHAIKLKNIHRVHSPFLYEFYTEVLPHIQSEAGKKIEAFRHTLLRNNEILTFEDLGAGSGGKTYGRVHRRLADMVLQSARKAREGELLYRICKQYQVKQALELGTQLGIGTMYQLAGMDKGTLLSIEGAKPVADKARAHLMEMGYTAEIRCGEFTEVLTQLNWNSFHPDYVLIDGNHKKVPTLEYFYYLLPRMRDQSIMIFDDIHWSEEMSQAWAEIIRHPQVSLSLDLFVMGICFIRRPQAKEHVHIGFRWW